jgi:hypothetical protein
MTKWKPNCLVSLQQLLNYASNINESFKKKYHNHVLSKECRDHEIAMLHENLSPPKNLHAHCSCVSRAWGLLGNIPKLLGTPSGTRGLVGRPQDVPGRFWGRSKQISGMCWVDFKDFLGRFQRYSEHISSVLTIMKIDDWTI